MTYLFETEEHTQLRDSVRRFAQEGTSRLHAHAWEEAMRVPARALQDRRGGEHARDLYPVEEGARAATHSRPRRGGGDGALRPVRRHRRRAQQSRYRAAAILRVGTEEQKKRFVLPVLRGEKVSALAITEPNGGSGRREPAHEGVRDGDVYVVNGSKTFITRAAAPTS